MPEVKRIVCLANSRKLHGRCIAGKEMTDGVPGVWIRPVSARKDEGVSETERLYEDGGEPCVLDIIDIALIEPRPKDHQKENWLLDSRTKWKQVGSLKLQDFGGLVDPCKTLWTNGQSTRHGQNDEVSASIAKGIESSLLLIEVESLEIIVGRFSSTAGATRRRVQGHFYYAGTEYRLWVTDPGYEQRCKAKPDGRYRLGRCLMTVSLSEPFELACYKLIAAIIEIGGGGKK
ncbi:hypothetical protein B7486_13445 [cyanobacterium TDX16]|nr:hypothetical protein B7486_13445 [cyanobacterium TDX16]